MQVACAIADCCLWPVWLYHILTHCRLNGTIFGKKFMNIKCLFSFFVQCVSETFLFLRRIEQDVIMFKHLHVKYLLFLSDFNETWIFLTDFWKIFKYQISWKSIQWVLSCFMQMDRWTDVLELTVAFCSSVNVPKNCKSYWQVIAFSCIKRTFTGDNFDWLDAFIMLIIFEGSVSSGWLVPNIFIWHGGPIFKGQISNE